MLGNKLLNIQFAKYHIWNNKSEGFPNMVLSTETFNQSVRTEYSEAVNVRYTFQPLWVSAYAYGSLFTIHGHIMTPGGRGGGVGGESHMKQTGMLVVSLRGVNFGFWSRIGCSRQSANILSRQGLVQGSPKKHRITRRETEVKFCF